MAPTRMAARIAAAVAMLCRPCARTRRAMCRCVTCAISCARRLRAPTRCAWRAPAVVHADEAARQREGIDGALAHREELKAGGRRPVVCAAMPRAERLQVLVDLRVIDDRRSDRAAAARPGAHAVFVVFDMIAAPAGLPMSGSSEVDCALAAAVSRLSEQGGNAAHEAVR